MQCFRKPLFTVLILGLLLSSHVIGQVAGAGDPSDARRDLDQIVENLDLDLTKSRLSREEEEVAQLISQRVSSTEWLGALAPVAISPFFGLTCLSGIAIMAEDQLPEGHYLRRAASPLRHPLVFVTFLLLTILTSLPKMSKVSKPFAQAVDQLETYSALIILLVIRFMGNLELAPDSEQQVEVVLKAGVFEFSAESLLMLATIVNVLVINTVKFFFEVLIWITPVPFIDAIFEAGSKATCALLVGIYAFSPALATGINVVLLVICLFAFRWVKRREVYYRSVLFDFLRNWFSGGGNVAVGHRLIVFPQADFRGIPKLARCELSVHGEGWQIVRPRWARPAVCVPWNGTQPTIQCGLLINQLEIDGIRFHFGRRYQRQLDALARECKLIYQPRPSTVLSWRGLAGELKPAH